jgi:hypothetical protein
MALFECSRQNRPAVETLRREVKRQLSIESIEAGVGKDVWQNRDSVRVLLANNVRCDSVKALPIQDRQLTARPLYSNEYCRRLLGRSHFDGGTLIRTQR